MSVPPPLSSGQSGAGHGPFGEKAFKGALIGCAALVVIGPLLVLAGGAVASVGVSFLVLGLLGLVTAGAGLLGERYLLRRRPAPPDLYRRNGHSPDPLDPSRIVKGFRDRP